MDTHTPTPIAPATPTPGPWRVVEVGTGNGPYGLIRAGAGVCVAHTYPPGDRQQCPPSAERMANAALLAAAPELRDALADLTSAAAVYSDLAASTHGRPALHAARALLARLTGGSTDGR